MPKFLVHQVLPEGGDLLRDHLEPGSEELAAQLVDPEATDVTWLWGCADLERNEWHMLFEAEEEEAITAFIARYPGIRSVTRVFYVHPGNLAWALVSGIAEGRKRRQVLPWVGDGGPPDDGNGSKR